MKNLNFYSLDVSGTQTLRMMVNETGNVGIGTSVATKKLEVVGDISFNGNIYQNGSLFTGGSSNFIGLSDTPSSFTANKFLAVNSGGNAVEFVNEPTGTVINETVDVSLNNLKVHGDLSANDVSFNVIDAASINVTGVYEQNGANINTIYATIASPTLTGTPLAPTASSGTNTTQIATTQFVSTAVSNLVNSAPGALDTLSELAAALDNSANFATNVTTTLGDLQTQVNSKQDTVSSSSRLNANLIHDGTVTNTEFGYLNGVTSAIQTQLDTKTTASSTDTFTNKTIDADGTGNSITNIDNANIKASAGIVYSKLSIADNDLTIAKTSGLQAALDAKQATLTAGSNITISGTTISSSSGGNIINETVDVSLNNLKVHGDLSANDVSFNVIDTASINVTGDYEQNGANINTIYATIASPTLTGTPAAPTASSGTNTTQIATTQFVSTAVSNLVNAAPGALDTLSELAAALDNSANFATNVTTTLGDLQTQINTKVTASSTDTFTNKTIDADGTGNSITNIDNANIKASAGIVYSKLSIADNDLTIAKTSGLQTALDEEFCKIGTQEYTVTVASKTATNYYNGTGSSSAFFINGNEGPYLKFTPGKKYKFLQDDGTNSNHPLKFYLEVNKTTEYSTNVTLSGTAGQSGSYTEIEITDSTPTKLYYQCANHSYMGNVVYIDGYSNIADGDLTIAKTSGLQAALDTKQATLTAGTNITINGTTISASGGGGGLTDLSATSISDLSDVSFNPISTTNGHALVWNSTDSVWEAGAVASSGGSAIDQTTDVSLNDLTIHGDISGSASSSIKFDGGTQITETSTKLKSWVIDNSGTFDISHVGYQSSGSEGTNWPKPRQEHSTIMDNSNNIIIFGGKDSGSNHLSDIWEYDIDTNTYTKKVPTLQTIIASSVKPTYSSDNTWLAYENLSSTGFINERSDNRSMVAYDDKVYYLTDTQLWVKDLTVTVSSPSTAGNSNWSQVTDISGTPPNNSKRGAFFYHNESGTDYLYYLFGVTDDDTSPETSDFNTIAYRYNISTKTWSFTSATNSTTNYKRMYSAFHVYDGYCFAYGGNVNASNYSNTFVKVGLGGSGDKAFGYCSTLSASVESGSNSITGRTYVSWAGQNEYMFIVGGRASNGNTQKCIFRYNCSNNTYRQITSTSDSIVGKLHWEEGMATIYDNKIIMASSYNAGTSGATNYLLSVDISTTSNSYSLAYYPDGSSQTDASRRINTQANNSVGAAAAWVVYKNRWYFMFPYGTGINSDGSYTDAVDYSNGFGGGISPYMWTYVFANGQSITTYDLVNHTSSLHDNNMYIFGGKNSSNTYANNLLRVALSNYTISSLTVSSLPSIRDSHSSATLNNKIYIFGGWDGSTVNNETWELDLSTDPPTSTQKQSNVISSVNINRYGHSAVIYDGNMYIFGGHDGTNLYNTIYKYNITNNSWTLLTTNGTSPSVRYYHTAFVTKDEMIVYGGKDAANATIQDSFLFDFSNSTWYNLNDDATTTHTPTSASISNYSFGSDVIHYNSGDDYKIYLYGGYNSQTTALLGGNGIIQTTDISHNLTEYVTSEVGIAFTFNTDNTGKVGIGKLIPTKTLDVGGDINFSGSLYQNGSIVNIGSSTFNQNTDLTINSLTTVNDISFAGNLYKDGALFKINDLSDVSFNSTTTVSGKSLIWDASNNIWEVGTPTSTLTQTVITQDAPTWSQITASSGSPNANGGHSGAIHGDYFYVFGGSNVNNLMYRIHLTTRAWNQVSYSTSGTILSELYGNLLFSYGDYVYSIFGTRHVSGYPSTNTVLRYNTTNNTLYEVSTSGTTVPTRQAGAIALYNDSGTDYLYYFGGRGSSYYNNMHRLNLSNHTWSTVTTSGGPPDTRYYIAHAYTSAKLYIYGGDRSSGDHSNDIWEFNLTNNTWSQLHDGTGTAPVGSYGTTMLYNNNYIYIFSGHKTSAGITDETWKFNLTNNTWSQLSLSSTPGKKYSPAYATDASNNLYIHGGYDDSYAFQSTIWKLTISDTSTVTTNLIEGIDVNGDISFNGNLYQNGALFTSGSTIDETTDVSVNNLSVHHSLDVSNSLIVTDGSTTSTTQTSYWYSDSSKFSWSLHNDGTSTAPVARNYHTSVIDNSNNIIIFGGEDSTSVRNDVWKYSITGNSWSELFTSVTPSVGSWDLISDSPASSSITGGAGYNKELYIMCDSGATFHKYNPSTDVWTTLASKSQSYYGSPQMVSHKGHIYTIDSVNGERSVWDYNISANSWTKLSNASDSAHDRYSTHASIYNGIIYVFAGRHIPYNQGYFSDIWTYNISTNTWSEITSVTTTLDGNSASFPTFAYGAYTSHGDNIYMVYGYASSGSAMNTVYIYNITNNTMTGYTTSMPANYTSTVSLHENCLYMFGGYVSSTNVNTLIKYDLETKTHTTISQSGTWPSARRDLRWATLGNTFYVLGGYTSSSSTDVWRYTLDDTPQKIKNTSSVLNGDEIITVFGGSNGNVCYSSIYNFNLTNNSWSYITPSKDTVAGDTTHGNQRGIPLERDEHTFVKYNNKAYLFGGKNGSTTYYDTWEYDLSTTTWTKKSLASSSYARYGHTSIIYNSNMYVFGGYNGTTYFNNVLKYDITNDSWSEYNDGTNSSTPSSRYGHVANLIHPEMIIFGGISANGAVEDSYAFDFGTNTWHMLDNDDANRPINPQSTSAELYNTGTGYKWFVFGGSTIISIASQILYENFEDQSYTGNVTSATIVSGGYNSSYALKGGGKNSYNRWRLGDTTFQSVSFWYYRDKANSGNQMEAMFDNNRGTNGENSLFFQTSSGGNLDKVHFTSSSSAVSKLYIDGVDESSAIHTSWSSGWSSTTYADNTWHHFYLEFASSQTSPITFGQPERANGFYDDPSEYVKWGGGGKFDNVRIFSGALTTTQIAILLENNNKMHVADISNANVNVNTTTYNGFTYNTNNDGRVSIGKLNPTKELDVVGDGIFTGSVTSSGSVLTSDDRVKHNEQSIVNALSTISKLTPKHYFKTGSHLYDASHNFVLNANGVPVNISNTPLILNKDYTVETGIIAQEIQSIPELRFVVQNTTPLGVDYNSIHCTHIAATKELHQIVQNQQIQIETIKELVQSQQTTIEEQQTTIEEQQQEIEQLKLYNIDSNNQINQLQQENQQLKNEIAIIKGHLGL